MLSVRSVFGVDQCGLHGGMAGVALRTDFDEVDCRLNHLVLDTTSPSWHAHINSCNNLPHTVASFHAANQQNFFLLVAFSHSTDCIWHHILLQVATLVARNVRLHCGCSGSSGFVCWAVSWGGRAGIRSLCGLPSTVGLRCSLHRGWLARLRAACHTRSMLL